jgi:ankyrin repeat protein
MQELNNITIMPLELWVRVLSFLSPNDLVMFAKSSRTNWTIAADHSLWKGLCQRWFPLFAENLLSLDNVDWHIEFIKQYRQINRPPFGQVGLYWLFLEADERLFFSMTSQYLHAGTDIQSLHRFLYLAQRVSRRYVLKMLYPYLIKKYGEITASIFCFYNERAIALLKTANETEVNNALYNSVLSGNLSLLSFCLQLGDIAKRISFINQKHLLHNASSSGFLNIVKVLLEANVDKNIKDNYEDTPLATACKNNQYGIIKLLIQFGAGDVGKQLICSATDGKYNVFIIFFSSSVITDQHKVSALLCLLSSWSYNSLQERKIILNLLLAAGINVNCTDKYGRTPLHYAAKIACSLMNQLISHGAAVDIQDRNGITPLHLAAQHTGQAEIEKLLHCGANINAKNRKGRCALHYAVMGRNVSGLNLLLINGADPMIEDVNGCTPLKLVKSLKMADGVKTNLMSLLKQYSTAKQTNSSITFFGKRKVTEIMQSIDMKMERPLEEDKRACRHDTPASEFRGLERN